MAQETIFRGAIEFFKRLGIYDVVLPFLLIFTIVFAILEKTKVFGTEKGAPKKNLNAMAAFVISLLVVASTELVAIVNESIANVVLLLLAVVAFLLLYGTFVKEGEPVFLTGGWKTAFMWAMLIGVVVIFLNAANWWVPFINWISWNWDTDVIGSIILLIIILVFIGYITQGEKPSSVSEKKE